MPNWILKAILGCSIASLALNGVVTWVVLSHTRGAVAPVPMAAPTATGAAPSAAARAVNLRDPYQRDWEYTDKATGRLRGAVLLDDSPRLEQFVRNTGLAPDKELALRDRWVARRAKEVQLARQMVKDGTWRHEEIRKLQRQFWDDEYRALPSEQAMLLPPEFMPVN